VTGTTDIIPTVIHYV